ncbi:uncharacterized protein LOC109815570 [Cajanus cajan]|uniref:uncharacterized protein LOC109815570 n=1 Tax=Cajanus cajan TaxID=3821 RepID=UPI0010FB5E4E|nr:uncharacterized protein LOC109815570 [Cajanus cajan]
MAQRFPFVVSCKSFVKHLQSTTSKAAIVSSNSNMLCITNANAHAHVHTQGGDSNIVGEANEGEVKEREVVENVGEKAKETVETALDAAKKSGELVRDSSTTIMAEADTNVVDTVEYRCTEGLGGQLGDGHDI